MSELFEDLAPPSGGLQRLRARMEEERSPSRLSWLPALAGAAAVALLLVWPRPAPAPPWSAADHPALARYGYELPTDDGVRAGAQTAVRQDGSRFYWVSPTRPPAAAP